MYTFWGDNLYYFVFLASFWGRHYPHFVNGKIGSADDLPTIAWQVGGTAKPDLKSFIVLLQQEVCSCVGFIGLGRAYAMEAFMVDDLYSRKSVLRKKGRKGTEALIYWLLPSSAPHGIRCPNKPCASPNPSGEQSTALVAGCPVRCLSLLFMPVDYRLILQWGFPYEIFMFTIVMEIGPHSSLHTEVLGGEISPACVWNFQKERAIWIKGSHDFICFLSL